MVADMTTDLKGLGLNLTGRNTCYLLPVNHYKNIWRCSEVSERRQEVDPIAKLFAENIGSFMGLREELLTVKPGHVSTRSSPFSCSRRPTCCCTAAPFAWRSAPDVAGTSSRSLRFVECLAHLIV